jgi:hypothetical protein
MKETSFFKPWLEGKYCMPDLDDLSTFEPDLQHNLWLSINIKLPFHKINEERILGFNECWEDSRSYYLKAINLVPLYEPYISLDNEDRYQILETLGDPPDVSHPIYIISVGEGSEEEFVYVGKSSSNQSRFTGGHSTAIKLLDPIYDGKVKNVYLCQVMLLSKSTEYLPLEFMKDKVVAKALLDDIESMLINHFKPIFNNKKTKSFRVKHSFSILTENVFTNSTKLNGITIGTLT